MGVNVIPLVAEAVNVIVSAVSCNAPEIVTLLVPLEMTPVVVPLSVPPPDALVKVTVVSLVTFRAMPPASCAWTVTPNGEPTVPVDGTVMTSFVGGGASDKVLPPVPVTWNLLQVATAPSTRIFPAVTKA